MDPSLLDRYLAGQSTPDEARLVETWIAEQLRDHGARYDGGLAMAVLRERMREAPETPVVDIGRARRRMRWPVPAALAAALLVGLGISLVRFQPHDRQYATGPNDRMTITLDDGSRVALNPSSTLHVLRSQRDVELSGDAYFVVKHDPAHPLTVH